jgi:predicted membrane protein
MKNPRSSQHLVLGIFILAFGVLSLLNNLSFFNLREYFQFWPLLIGAFGVLKLSQANCRGDYIIGTSLIAVSVLMMLNKLGIIHFRLREFWPILIIIAGLLIIFRENNRNETQTDNSQIKSPDNLNAVASSSNPFSFNTNTVTSKSTNPINSTTQSNPGSTLNSDSKIDLISFMGGNVATINSQDFQGGQATAFMGGVEIDLRNANIQSQAVLNVFAMFGGISIVLPLDWTLVNNTSAFLGGVDYKQSSGVNDSKKCLIVQGTVMLGGIEIKHKL